MKQKVATSVSQGNDRLYTTWAILESRHKFPSIILVTSATDVDDTESVARGLSAVSHEAGHRTGYARLKEQSTISGDAVPAYSEVVLTSRPSEREGFDRSIQAWRESYDVVFVDVGSFSSNTLAAHAARLADGVVIAVCEDRRVLPADRELSTTLSQLSAVTLGAVKTAKSSAPAGRKSRQPSLFPDWLFPVRQQ